MKCKRCLNEDPEWFYLGSKGCIVENASLLEEF